VKELEGQGLVVSATHLKGIVEMTEWKDSFGVATQAHVELKSRLETPAPLFVEFMKAAKDFRGKPSKSAGETHGE
jgi:CTP synthase